MAITPNMDLDLPTVSSTLGPEWASDLNTALEVIDLHDHSAGSGVKITPAGIDINADLDFDNNQAQNLKSAGLYSKLAADAAHLGSIQRIGGDLYWVNSAGASVQITSGASVVSSGSGTWTVSVIAAYPYTVLTSDAQKILKISTASARTLTLPAATTAMMVGVKDYTGSGSTNNITVTPDGTDTIDSVNGSDLIQEDYGMRFYISDGVSAWDVV